MAEVRTLRQLIACLNGSPLPKTNWDAVLEMANRTLTTGTLAQALWSHRARVPSEVQDFLAEVLERVERRNALLRDQLEQAVAWLDRSGIRPIILKGAAALLGAPSVHGRMLSDIDVMVPESQMPAAIRCLERIGYAVSDDSSKPPNPVTLARPIDAGAIDLHAQLKASWPRYDYHDLKRLCVTHPVRDGQVLLPTPTTQAFILIMHDQLQDRDYWRGLIDLRHALDLHTLAAASPGIDWAMLDAMFPAGFAKRALHSQLCTLSRIMGTPVPGAYRRGLLPMAQFWRRLIQLDWPATMRAFTLVSLALDPPVRPKNEEREAGSAPPAPGTTKNRLKRMQREKALGKV